MDRHISAARHPIPDVPVIYFVEPNATSLQNITADLQNGLYSPAYINFLSSIPRPLLEDFAAQTATAGTAEHIAQLFDQYLNFIVAEPDLFSLGMQREHTYWALNSAKTKDEELDYVVDRIVSGLFSVIVTMGAAARNSPALITGAMLTHGRYYPRNPMPKRCRRRHDRRQTGSEAS